MFKNAKTPKPTTVVNLTTSLFAALNGVRLTIKSLGPEWLEMLNIKSANIYLTAPRQGKNTKFASYFYRTAKVDAILRPNTAAIENSIIPDHMAHVVNGIARAGSIKAVFRFTLVKPQGADWTLAEFENFAKIGNQHAEMLKFDGLRIHRCRLDKQVAKDLDFSFTR